MNILEEEVQNLETLNNIFENYGLVFMQVNIRGIKTKFETLEAYVQNLKVKPDVISCAESRFVLSHKFFKLPGYEICYNKSKINIADGVILYVKNTLARHTDIVLKKILDITYMSVVLILANEKYLKVTSVYRCHDVSQEAFINSLEYFVKIDKHLDHIIMGDFNIDILASGDSSDNFLCCLLENGFLPCFTSITRPNDKDNKIKEGSCIDNIFVKFGKPFQTKAFKIAVPFLDHYPLFLTTSLEPVTDKNDKIKLLINYKKLRELASHTDWTLRVDFGIDDAINDLILKIQNLIKLSRFELKKSRRDPRQEWATGGILKSIKKKEYLYNLYKKDRNNEAIK